jgi:hypothetical protein
MASKQGKLCIKGPSHQAWCRHAMLRFKLAYIVLKQSNLNAHQSFYSVAVRVATRRSPIAPGKFLIYTSGSLTTDNLCNRTPTRTLNLLLSMVPCGGWSSSGLVRARLVSYSPLSSSNRKNPPASTCQNNCTVCYPMLSRAIPATTGEWLVSTSEQLVSLLAAT